jgi:hypothetical protein
VVVGGDDGRRGGRFAPPAVGVDARTLYSVAVLYATAAERISSTYLPLAYEMLGRTLLATTEEMMWVMARNDPELAADDRQRFLDDLSRSWNARRLRRLGPLVGDEAKAVIDSALARLYLKDDGPLPKSASGQTRTRRRRWSFRWR